MSSPGTTHLVDIIRLTMRETDRPICKWCNVYEDEHSRDVLATECFPAQLAAKDAVMRKMREALELIRNMSCTQRGCRAPNIANDALTQSAGLRKGEGT